MKTQKYEWTTERGAKVEITVETVTLTETVCDGEVAKEKSRKEITEMRVNGEAVADPKFNGQKSATVRFTSGNRRGETHLPAEVDEEVWERKEELEREEKAEREDATYRESRKKVLQAMDY